jgi:DNA-binding LacI/PurR family transcriptional regulator
MSRRFAESSTVDRTPIATSAQRWRTATSEALQKSVPSPRRSTGKRLILADVAAAAGVSRSLASIVMRGAPGASDETRRRVLQVASDLGYRRDVRASLLRRTHTRLIGILFRVESQFHASLVSAIHGEALAAGYEVVLGGQYPNAAEERSVETLLEYRCDALIVLGTSLTQGQIESYARSVPVVMVTSRTVKPEPPVDSVWTDDRRAYRLALDHLLALGHTEISHVDGGPGIKSDDRRRAYRNAMTRSGLHDRTQVFAGGETAEAGWAAAETVLAAPRRPTAILSYNDEVAWGLIGRLVGAGIAIPRDISVIGYDGIRLGTLMPPTLTTLRQDTGSLAAHAVSLAISRISGDEPPSRNIILPPVFVAGQTTGPRRDG